MSAPHPTEQMFAGTFAAWVEILNSMEPTLRLLPGRYKDFRFTLVELDSIMGAIQGLTWLLESKCQEWTDGTIEIDKNWHNAEE